MMDSEQMQRRIRQRIALTHELAPDTIGTYLQFELLECSAETGEYTLRCKTAQWMKNVMNSLHGGISATVADHAMGIVANSIRHEEGIGPTVQLQLSYHRPLVAGEDILVKVRVLSVSKSMTHLTAEAFSDANPDVLCLSATGIYYFKPTL